MRKDFTVSERVAIAAIKAEIGNRQGQRSDLPAREGKFTGETADEVTRRAGFGSAETLRRAETVVEHGTPELVDKVDKGEVSIKAGAKIAKPPAPASKA